jgi:hypothetical protein
MNISIKIIPHNEQRYETVGDWQFTSEGDLIISISKMDNWKYETLVAIHELIEVVLCKDRNITDESVIAFDKKFEEMRLAYPDIIGDDEPGNHPKAPYVNEHNKATMVEVMMAQELKVDWSEYDKTVQAL